MKKILISPVIIFVLMSFSAWGQKNTIILLKGKIIDQNSNPVSTNIKLIDNDGKTFALRSNATEGEFQQPLPAGKDYKIVLEKYCPAGSEKSLNIPSYGNYVEIEKNIHVKYIEKGDTLNQSSVFAPDDSIPGNELTGILSYLRESMKLNKGLYLDIVISTADCHFKDSKEKREIIVKGKKKSKIVTVKSHELAENLFEARERNLRDQLSTMKLNLNNIAIKPCIVVTKPIKTQKSKKKGKDREEPENAAENVHNILILVNKFMKL